MTSIVAWSGHAAIVAGMSRTWAQGDRAFRMLAAGVAPLLVALAGGCTRQAAPSPPPSTPTQPAAPDETLPPPAVEVPPADPGPCAADGRLWDGKPQDCSYEHAGCCYGSAATACAAAGCSTEECQVLESYPAQIRCIAPASKPPAP
jgi:hypothetical protein